MKLANVDHRLSPRSALGNTVAATLTVGGKTFDGSVLDYSIQGLSVRVEKNVLKRAERENFEIELGLHDQAERYLGKIRHSRLDEDDVIVGLRLETAKTDDEVSFLSDDPGWDLIEDEETLKNIFGDLAFKGPEAPIEFKQFKNRATLLAHKIKDEKILVAEIFETKKGTVEAGRGSFRFELFQTCHAFEAIIVAVRGNIAEIELPKKVARLLRRETVRILNGANDVTLKARLHSKFLGISPEEIEVLDFSEHGLSILDKTGWAYAPIGVTFDSITIVTPDGNTIHGTGSIRGHKWLADKEAYSVGIEFETATDQDRTKWHNAILAARYPSLAFQYREADHKEIWNLFDRSGYLDLQDRDAFTPVIDITKITWKKLSDAGTRISKRAVIRMNDLVVGHLQLDRIYPDTWCVHHLAIDPKISRIVGRELYSVTADVLSSEGARHILSLTQASKPWNQRNYYDFVKTYRFPDQNELRMYQLYEIALDKNWDLSSNSSFDLRLANRYDLQRIARYFELHGTSLERNACGLTQEHLGLQTLHSEISPFGLSRNREFIVATLNGKLVGFARLETGSPGLNIWGLQDMIYIHLLPDLGAIAEMAHETLIDGALKRMRDLDKKNVIMLLDDGRSDYYGSKGLNYIWDAVRWIAMCAVSRRYHAYSQMLYGHLLNRREGFKKRRQTG